MLIHNKAGLSRAEPSPSVYKSYFFLRPGPLPLPTPKPPRSVSAPSDVSHAALQCPEPLPELSLGERALGSSGTRALRPLLCTHRCQALWWSKPWVLPSSLLRLWPGQGCPVGWPCPGMPLGMALPRDALWHPRARTLRRAQGPH